MPHAQRTASTSTRITSRRSRAKAKDAVALLKADHREVEGLFAQFQKSRSSEKKGELAARICEALRTHMTIEEEIFYPAFLEETGEEDLHHEAEVEHAGAENLIAQIEASDPEEDYFDAKVKVLSEMIRHHVKEEEKRDGMFAKAKAADMDLESLGEMLAQRKQELQEALAARN